MELTEIWKYVAIFEINALKFLLLQNFVKEQKWNQKCLIWLFWGWKFKKRLKSASLHVLLQSLVQEKKELLILEPKCLI